MLVVSPIDDFHRAELQEFSILNVVDHQLELHQGPVGGIYSTVKVLSRSEEISALITRDDGIWVLDLLP